jgi:hypothetical protein
MKRLLFHAIFCLVAVTLAAQERITLTSPEAAPSVQKYRVADFNLHPDDPDTPDDEGRLFMVLVGVERPVVVNCLYDKSTATTGTFLITALNKANLSSAYNNNATTGSLTQRVFHRLVVMGESTAVCGKTLTGTLTGSPQ